LVLDGDALNDALVVTDEAHATVTRYMPVTPELLTDFLNSMDQIRSSDSSSSDHAPMNPGNWGDLVLARADAGEVLFVDPELYWDGIATWFRAHGSDPHLWRSYGSHAPTKL
jgi:hypothetical protein